MPRFRIIVFMMVEITPRELHMSGGMVGIPVLAKEIIIVQELNNEPSSTADLDQT